MKLSAFSQFIGHYVEIHTLQTHTIMTGDLREISDDCIVLRERIEIHDVDITEHYADHVIMNFSIYAISHNEGDCQLCIQVIGANHV